MDFNLKKALTGALFGFITALAFDLQKFGEVTKEDELATFSWRIASLRWLKGALTGFTGAVGLEQV